MSIGLEKPMVPPVLSTARLRLVPPSAEHRPGLFAYGRKPEFVAHIDASPFATIEDAGRFLDHLVHEASEGKRLYWVVERQDDNVVVGTLGFLFTINPFHQTAEFGYGMDPAVWGSGVFQEAASVVIAYGFRELGLYRLQAVTRAGNRPSIRAVEKIGFRREGQLAAFYRNRDGQREDAVILGLVRNDP